MVLLRIFGFVVSAEPPGVVGSGRVYICSYGCWMHVCGSLPELTWSVLTEFKSDRHLVG